MVFPLGKFDNLADITDAILGIPYLGQTTNTPDALRVARSQCFNVSNGDRMDVSDMAILITDGVPFPAYRRPLAIAEAQRLQGSGVRMISVGISHVVDLAFLQEMSSPPHTLNRNYFRITDFQSLQLLVPDTQKVVEEEICQQAPGMSPVKK